MTDSPTTPAEPTPTPWPRLLGALGASLDARSLILASIGILLLWGGWSAIDAVAPEGTATALAPRVERRLRVAGDRVRPQVVAVERDGRSLPLDRPWDPHLLAYAADHAADPVTFVAVPFARLFDRSTGTRSFFHALLAAAWALVVWGLVGGAIARVAAVRAATLEREGLGAALGFAATKAGALLGAPLSALTGIAFFAALAAGFGALARIPGPVGPTVVGALAVLPLLGALVMALILVGLAAGWPLMVAGVAVEREDRFDALSRAYAYVYQRPLKFVACVLVAWAAGAVGFLAVTGFARLVVHLAEWSLAFGASTPRVAALDSPGPADPPLATPFFRGWLWLAGLVAYSWAFSYFWSVASYLYLLLRLDVDGAPWHDVDLDAEPSGPDAEAFAPAAKGRPVASAEAP
ncbi:MAG TPA: hypothetical protein VG406_25870 [Isosphaeraceae bacterium]|jgi:hypothetical protein|nr:hypothetical protein [Isosphaeraceae bacterium]